MLYPISMIEGQNEIVAWAIRLNPMSWYVQAMHDAMYSLTGPGALEVLALFVGGFLVFWAGFVIFERTSEDIGELL